MKIYLILTIIAACLMFPEVVQAGEIFPVEKDSTVELHGTADWTSEKLYLDQSHYLVFHFPIIHIDSAYEYYLNLYSVNPSYTGQYAIYYSDESTPNHIYAEIKPGWNKILLTGTSQFSPVSIIMLKAISPISGTFYGNALDVSTNCNHKFSPFISSVLKGSGPGIPDQTFITTQIKIPQKQILLDISKPKIEKQTTGEVLGLSASKPAEIKTTEPRQAFPKLNNNCVIKDYTLIKPGKIKIDCKLDKPTIYNLRNQKIENKFKISLDTYRLDSIDLVLETFRCRPFGLDNPLGLFICSEEKSTSTKIDIEPRIEQLISINNIVKTATLRQLPILNIADIWTDKDKSNSPISIKYRYSWNQKLANGKASVRVESPATEAIIPKVESKSEKPLNFIFKKFVGVTQWFGKTAYSNFHTGIDFAVKEAEIFSPAQGEVINYAWDNYYGECNSGGNILKIKHTSLYTVYMHLKTSLVKPKTKLVSNQKVAISGNTGRYDCKPLGYHLHFEVRKNSSQKSAVNPVDYIETDWSKIKTVDINKFPGRLTGNNPHPTY